MGNDVLSSIEVHWSLERINDDRWCVYDTDSGETLSDANTPEDAIANAHISPLTPAQQKYSPRYAWILLRTDDKTVHDLIHERRVRHLKHGYDAVHDDSHIDGELIKAAQCYIANYNGWKESEPPMLWPFENGSFKVSESAVDNLVEAAAFIVAEIERLQRKSS